MCYPIDSVEYISGPQDEIMDQLTWKLDMPSLFSSLNRLAGLFCRYDLTYKYLVEVWRLRVVVIPSLSICFLTSKFPRLELRP
jgi:hypothetical protein